MLDKIVNTVLNAIIFVPFWGVLIISGLYLVQDLVNTTLMIVESLFTAIFGG